MQTTLLAMAVLVRVVPALTAPTEPGSVPQISLTELLANHFGNLYLAEKRLAAAAEIGETADCTDLSGDDKNIRGDLLAWLCTDPDASAEITYRGISIVGAEIVKQLDLEWAKISFPIVAINCVFRDSIFLDRSHMFFLNLAGSSVSALKANSAHFEAHLFLRSGFRAEGGVDLTAAKIDGDLDCEGAQFMTKAKTPALSANRAEIKGSVLLRNGFRAEGGVDLTAAKIDGFLECNGGQFYSDGETPALNVKNAEAKRGIYLRDGFKAEGGVNLLITKIGGNLDCTAGQFIGSGKTPALYAKGVEVTDNIFLNDGFNAEGEVNLVAAKIEGNLECGGGQFVSTGEGPVLDANSVEVKGGVHMNNGFKAQGGVSLVAAKIEGNLECGGGQFIGTSQAPALNTNKAKIGGDLACGGGQFVGNDKALALDVNGAAVKRRVFLTTGFKSEGGVDLRGAKIEGDLDCGGGRFIGNAKTPALDASDAKIEGSAVFNAGFAAEGNVDFVGSEANVGLAWSRVTSPEKFSLDLRLSKVGKLLNPRNSWPNQGRLHIDGFVYDQIADVAPANAEVQLGWISLQPHDRFRSQPFEQLAGVLRKMGLEEDARAVMIAKNEEHAQYVQGQPAWLWYGLFGHVIGYGYRPWRAFFISLAVIGAGWLLFCFGYRRRLITPTSDAAYGTVGGWRHQLLESYPKFNSLVYSLETFVRWLKWGSAIIGCRMQTMAGG